MINCTEKVTMVLNHHCYENVSFEVVFSLVNSSFQYNTGEKICPRFRCFFIHLGTFVKNNGRKT
jgi:hypothetical protein